MSRCDEPQTVFVHNRCTWCILSTEDRPWLTTTSTDIVTAAVAHIPRLDRGIVTSHCNSMCSLGRLTDKGYTRVLRLPHQGVEKKREARAFTKPRSSES